ncbi:MAG: hypothetical protein ACI9FJ_000844 [Alteromonadaceae bacterium]|jgi:hypothetical protein
MLNQSLLVVKQKLEQHLKNRFGLQENIVVLNPLVEPDGSAPQKNQNKMVITLINLVQETNKQYSAGHQRRGQSVIKVNPALYFNLYVLFTASFDDYEEALKFLNATIGFFQANISLNCTSELKAAGVMTLKFDIEDATHNELHSLWSAMGAKYRPSIMYKVRSVSIQSDEIKTVVPEIQQVNAEVQP